MTRGDGLRFGDHQTVSGSFVSDIELERCSCLCEPCPALTERMRQSGLGNSGSYAHSNRLNVLCDPFFEETPIGARSASDKCQVRASDPCQYYQEQARKKHTQPTSQICVRDFTAPCHLSRKVTGSTVSSPSVAITTVCDPLELTHFLHPALCVRLV